MCSPFRIADVLPSCLSTGEGVVLSLVVQHPQPRVAWQEEPIVDSQGIATVALGVCVCVCVLVLYVYM